MLSSEIVVAFAAATLLIAAIGLGGASRQHEIRLSLVILASLPLLVFAGSAVLADDVKGRITPLAFALLGGTALIPLLQLVPLPPSFWVSLPGRQDLVLALDLADIQPAWTSFSMTPDRTWRSFLALIPPVAIFFGVMAVQSRHRLRLIQLLLVLTMVSIVLAVVQLASGSDALYPWRTTDAGNASGFFANRNHFATLCLMAIPFLGVIAARSLRRQSSKADLWIWLSSAGIALAIVAIGVGRSRAGVALTVPVLGATLLAVWIGSGRGKPKTAVLIIAGAVTAAMLAVAVFALGPILARFDLDGAREGRFENWERIWEAASQYLPMGSGLGSFDAVYRSVEPLQTLDSSFLNQAHNDYLETWLETGWAGAALVIAFLVWFGRRAWTAWRARPTRERDLQRAATVAVGVVLAHSAVDYPLRTETIAVVFAMMCALVDMAARSDDALAQDGPQQRSPRRRRSV